MDSRDRLRLRLVGTGCGACGRPYRASGIRVLAQREDLAFVMLRCESCGTDGLALIAGEATDVDRDDIDVGTAFGSRVPGGGSSELTGSELARFRDQAPIGADDVLAMHTLLAGYRGDIRGLLADDGRGAAER